MTYFDSFFRPNRLLYLTAPAPEPSSPPDPDPVPPTPPPGETPQTPVPPANQREAQNEAWPPDTFETSTTQNIVGQNVDTIRNQIGVVLDNPDRFDMRGLRYTPAQIATLSPSADGVSQEALERIGGGNAMDGVLTVQRETLLRFFEHVAEEERREQERSRLRSPVTIELNGMIPTPVRQRSRAQELFRDYVGGLLARDNPELDRRARRVESKQVYARRHYDATHLDVPLQRGIRVAPGSPTYLDCINDLLNSKERSDSNPDLLALKRLAVAYPQARNSIRTLYERDPNRRKHELERNVTRETESVTALATLKTNFETLAAKRREEQTLTERINRQPLIERFKTFESYKTALDVMGPSYDEWIKENQACDGFQRDINLYGAPATGLIAVTQNQLNTERGRLLQRPATIASLTTQLTGYETKLVAAQQQFREAEARRTAARSKLSLEAGKLQNLLVGVAPFAATLPAFPCNLRGILPPAFVAIICPPPPVPPAISTVTLDPTAHADILNLKQQVVTAQNTLRADPLFSAVSSTDIAAGDQDALRTELSTCQKEIRDVEAAMRTAAGTLTSNTVPEFAVPTVGNLNAATFVQNIIAEFLPPFTATRLLPAPTDPFVTNYLAALSAQKTTLDQRSTTATTQRDRVAGPEDKKPLKNLTAEQLLYFVVRDMMENGVMVAGQRIAKNSEYAVKLAVNLLHVDATTNAMRATNEKIARELGRTGIRGRIGRAWNHSRLNRRTMSFQDILASMSHMREYRALERLARNPRSRPIVLADVRQIVDKKTDGHIDRDLLTDLANNLEGVLSDQITGVRIRDDHAIYLQNLIELLRQVWAEVDAQDFSHGLNNKNIFLKVENKDKDAKEGLVRTGGDEFIMDLLQYQRFHRKDREAKMKAKFPNRPEWQTFLRRGELTQHLRDLRTQMKDKSPEDRRKLLDSYGITSIPATISAIMRGEDLLRASGKFAKEKSQSMASGAWNGLKNSPEYIGDKARGLGRGLLGLGQLALWPYKTLFWTAPKAVAPHVARAGSSVMDTAGSAVRLGGKILFSPVTLPISLASWLLRPLKRFGSTMSEEGSPLSVRINARNTRIDEKIKAKKEELKLMEEALKSVSPRAQKKLQAQIYDIHRDLFKLNKKKRTVPPVSTGGYSAAAHH